MNSQIFSFKGLCRDDLIIQFGPLHADIFTRLDQLKEVVEKYVNVGGFGVSLFIFPFTHHFLQKPIRITALRQNRLQKLQLVPQIWNGQGLVGCAFTMIDREKKP